MVCGSGLNLRPSAWPCEGVHEHVSRAIGEMQGMKCNHVTVLWVRIDGFSARRIPCRPISAEQLRAAAVHHVSSVHVDKWPVRTGASTDHNPVGVFKRIGIAAVVK